MKTGTFQSEITVNGHMIDDNGMLHVVNRKMTSNMSAFVFAFDGSTGKIEAYGGGMVDPNIIANVLASLASMTCEEAVMTGVLAYVEKTALNRFIEKIMPKSPQDG